ncbi:hypothetical protein [Sandaracinus amylolyticus]|uniref:hypothetical protein n=1 Tax=Sandaracinus amylolyticus TaxID=927083 RepID=UPI001F2A6B46|nr:hypothetical protein [Sandaracinus amylolyticus]UJR81568.1 Hypothetical protein I5071_36280 [Sandaracinus amylolyticus]
MAATKKTKKTTKVAAKKRATKKAPTRAAVGLDTSRAWSLDEIERDLPPTSEARVAAVREALARAYGNEKLVDIGATYRTEEILAVAPNVAASALHALRTLDPPPRGLAPELLRLLVVEGRELARIDLAYEQQLRDVASEIAGRRDALKVAKGRALRERRVVATHLARNVVALDSPHRAELQRASAKAPTASAAVASARTVARILEELRADPQHTLVLDAYGYDDALVARLRELADETERLAGTGAALTPPQHIDQRALDRQDGLVLAILRAIVGALRNAQSEGASISLPSLGGLERFVVSARDASEDEEGEDEEPAAS